MRVHSGTGKGSGCMAVTWRLRGGYVAVTSNPVAAALEVVSTRIQAGTGAGSGYMTDTARLLWQEGGLGALYKGVLTSAILSINPAINCTPGALAPHMFATS